MGHTKSDVSCRLFIRVNYQLCLTKVEISICYSLRFEIWVDLMSFQLANNRHLECKTWSPEVQCLFTLSSHSITVILFEHPRKVYFDVWWLLDGPQLNNPRYWKPFNKLKSYKKMKRFTWQSGRHYPEFYHQDEIQWQILFAGILNCVHTLIFWQHLEVAPESTLYWVTSKHHCVLGFWTSHLTKGNAVSRHQRLALWPHMVQRIVVFFFTDSCHQHAWASLLKQTMRRDVVSTRT